MGSLSSFTFFNRPLISLQEKEICLQVGRGGWWFCTKKSCFVRFYLSLSLLTSGREHHGFCLGESWVFPPIKTIMIFGAPPTRQSLRCNLLSKQIRQKAIGKGFLAVVFYTLVCYEIHMVQGCVLSMKWYLSKEKEIQLTYSTWHIISIHNIMHKMFVVTPTLYTFSWGLGRIWFSLPDAGYPAYLPGYCRINGYPAQT